MLSAFAAGTVLAARADKVLPEAYGEGGRLVAFATSGGFLVTYPSRRSTDSGWAAAGDPARSGAQQWTTRGAAAAWQPPPGCSERSHEEGDEMTSTLIETQTTVGTQTTLEWWTVDPTRATVEFEVDHFWGLHTVRGRFQRFDGSYSVGPAGQEIELAIDAASVDTGIAPRDRHLRSADFFDVDEHPEVRFTSTRVTGRGGGQVRVSGELAVAGTSVPLAFDASVRMIGGELEIEATATVDQRPFGMSQGPLRNIRHPAKVHVKARLVRETSE